MDHEKKGLWQGLKGAFVEEVPEKVKEVPHVSVTAPAPVISKPIPTLDQHTIKADPEVVGRLENLTQQTTSPAFKQFNEHYDALADVGLDEGARVRAALKTSHTTIQDVISVLDKRIEAVNRAKAAFDDDFKHNMDNLKSQQRASSEASESLIAQREAQLLALQQEIASLRAKLDTDRQHQNADILHLMTVADGFDAAHSQVVSKLDEQKSHLSAFLKG